MTHVLTRWGSRLCCLGFGLGLCFVSRAAGANASTSSLQDDLLEPARTVALILAEGRSDFDRYRGPAIAVGAYDVLQRERDTQRDILFLVSKGQSVEVQTLKKATQQTSIERDFASIKAALSRALGERTSPPFLSSALKKLVDAKLQSPMEIVLISDGQLGDAEDALRQAIKSFEAHEINVRFSVIRTSAKTSTKRSDSIELLRSIVPVDVIGFAEPLEQLGELLSGRFGYLAEYLLPDAKGYMYFRNQSSIRETLVLALNSLTHPPRSDAIVRRRWRRYELPFWGEPSGGGAGSSRVVYWRGTHARSKRSRRTTEYNIQSSHPVLVVHRAPELRIESIRYASDRGKAFASVPLSRAYCFEATVHTSQGDPLGKGELLTKSLRLYGKVGQRIYEGRDYGPIEAEAAFLWNQDKVPHDGRFMVCFDDLSIGEHKFELSLALGRLLLAPKRTSPPVEVLAPLDFGVRSYPLVIEDSFFAPASSFREDSFRATPKAFSLKPICAPLRHRRNRQGESLEVLASIYAPEEMALSHRRTLDISLRTWGHQTPNTVALSFDHPVRLSIQEKLAICVLSKNNDWKSTESGPFELSLSAELPAYKRYGISSRLKVYVSRTNILWSWRFALVSILVVGVSALILLVVLRWAGGIRKYFPPEFAVWQGAKPEALYPAALPLRRGRGGRGHFRLFLGGYAVNVVLSEKTSLFALRLPPELALHEADVPRGQERVFRSELHPRVGRLYAVVVGDQVKDYVRFGFEPGGSP